MEGNRKRHRNVRKITQERTMAAILPRQTRVPTALRRGVLGGVPGDHFTDSPGHKLF